MIYILVKLSPARFNNSNKLDIYIVEVDPRCSWAPSANPTHNLCQINQSQFKLERPARQCKERRAAGFL